VVRLQPFPATGPGAGAASDGDGEVVVLLPPHADAKNTSRTTDTPRFLDIGGWPSADTCNATTRQAVTPPALVSIASFVGLR
jgi:hypothetical protein